MTPRRENACPCGRFPDPGIKPGGGCWCTEQEIAYFKVRGADGYYRRRFSTSEDAASFVATLQSIVAFDNHGKIVWEEPADA